MRNPRANVHGFTMIELVITVTVAGILMALAVPAFNTFIQNQRLTTATNSLVLGLNYARSEAIKRDVTTGITICASSDQQTCNTTNWSQGWVVLDPGNNPLQAGPATGTNVTISEVAGPKLPQVVFQPNGTVTAAASFTVCDLRGSGFAHSIDVGPTGRVLTSTTPGQSVAGAALVCP